jgi:hypothetical protein
MMKLFLFLSILPSLLFSQNVKPKIKENGIYITNTDFINHNLTLGFNKHEGYKMNHNRKELVIVKTETSKNKFFKDKIWGFREKGEDWRRYNIDYFKVDQLTAEICLYKKYDSQDTTISWRYFSKNLNSDVYPLDRKNLIEVYMSDTAVTKKIRKLFWGEGLYKWDRQKHRYKFIEWLSKR